MLENYLTEQVRSTGTHTSLPLSIENRTVFAWIRPVTPVTCTA